MLVNIFSHFVAEAEKFHFTIPPREDDRSPDTCPQISPCVSQLSSIKVHILINAIDLTAFAFTCVLLPWLLQPKSFCFINMLTKRFMQIMAVKYIFLIFKHLYLKYLPTESLNTLNAYGSSQNF